MYHPLTIDVNQPTGSIFELQEPSNYKEILMLVMIAKVLQAQTDLYPCAS